MNIFRIDDKNTKPRPLITLAFMLPFFISMLIFDQMSFQARIVLVLVIVAILIRSIEPVKNYFAKKRNRS